MGAIPVTSKMKSFKILLHIILITILVLSSNVQGLNYSLNQTSSQDQIISSLSGQIEISSQSDYYIKFDSQNKTLEKQELPPVSTGFSEIESQAIAKTPKWIQRKLIQQFKTINNTDNYVQLLLQSDKQFTDEIAFTIAHSPLGMVPPAEVIEENAHLLYQIDPFIQYADIIDYDEGNGNYYSTIRYWVLENGTTKSFEYPKEIYYWYVVHPRINREEPMFVYERTWRNYLFYHNDVGHPLIKENVANISYLWDGQSHTQNTGIRAIQHWMSNTIRYQIIGNRPGQPNKIAHEHTGYCGETQKLAVAAFRSALIPMNGVMNYAEDHVWSEFYERGWYHYDGAINKPYMYTDGWKKNMSSIWAWNGDSSIYEVTPTYLHPQDRITAEFTIHDGYNNPLDGAIVTVLVKGLKDITWYKNRFANILDTLWEKIPEILKIRILQNIYESLHHKIDDIEEVIDTYQVSIWNYTDTNGRLKLNLGKNDRYLFLIQKPNQRSTWPFYRFTRIRAPIETKNNSYTIRFLDFSNPVHILKESNQIQGTLKGHITLDLNAYQLQKNILTTDIGTYTKTGKLDFFIVDEQNFERYQTGKTFDYYYYQEVSDTEIDFHLDDQDYYIIFRNHAHMTNVIVDYKIDIKSSEDIDTIMIVTPTTDLFEKPLITIGTTLDITGISTHTQLILTIGDEITKTLTTHNNTWHYQWNTKNSEPGTYQICAESGPNKDILYIQLIDTIPPTIEIISPNNMDIFENEIVTISGNAEDNYQLQKVELIINENTPILLNGSEEWSYNLNMTQLEPGEYVIQAKSYDNSNLSTNTEITIIKNDSEHQWSPNINSLFITPENPTNTSSIRIFSNVTSDSLFSIRDVFLYYDNETGPINQKMFRYGDHPPQDRHIEDNIQNIPNNPIYGFEIGYFQTAENISYWIEAFDTVGNKKTSEIKSFIIT
jgi:hypothetical protein